MATKTFLDTKETSSNDTIQKYNDSESSWKINTVEDFIYKCIQHEKKTTSLSDKIIIQKMRRILKYF